MENMKIKELMRPIDEFPRISVQATFIEAAEALEKADQEFNSGKATQRILIVYDKSGKIIGKMSPMDLVKGLEPNYLNIDIAASTPYYRLTQTALESMNNQIRLWHKPLEELYKKAYATRINDFIKMPTPDHIVKIDDNIDKAFHLFVVGRHDSLFVKSKEDIVGLIRFSDVYRKIKEIIRTCPVPE